MKCPKCGHENPDNTQRCGSCSLIWAKPEPSHWSRALPLLGGLLFALAVVLSVFVKPTLGFIAALLAFCSVISGIRMNWSRRKFRAKAIGAGILILSSLFILTLTYLRIDAAPIPDDYTISDLRSAPPKCDHTYEVLGRLTDVGLKMHSISPTGLSAEEIRRLEEIHDLCKEKDLGTITLILKDNASKIIDIWQHAQKGREVITRLNEFPEIADLAEPSLRIQKEPWLFNIRRLAFLYRLYACLQSSRGNHKIALDTLLQYDSFVEKLSLNARSILVNLVCMACSDITIDTANFIINNPGTPQESLMLLRRHVIPLSHERISLRNPLVFEYIAWKKRFLKTSNDARYRYRTIAPLKLNSTLRLSMNFLGGLIAIEEGGTKAKELEVWPTLYPNLPVEISYDSRLPWYYKMYNPLGTKVIGIYAPAINNILVLRTKLQIHSDLLKIVLVKRIGEEVSLRARAYSEEYIVDVENKKIFSPGPDGEPGTKDDISLLINPDVLGWGK